MSTPTEIRFRHDFHDDKLQIINSAIKMNAEFDVTLQCMIDSTASNWISIPAHSLLIASMSATIRDILEKNSLVGNEQFVVNLVGIYQEELQYILSYIYSGNVDIPEDRLPNFLEAANLLQVRGLIDENAKLLDPCNKSAPFVCQFTSQPPANPCLKRLLFPNSSWSTSNSANIGLHKTKSVDVKSAKKPRKERENNKQLGIKSSPKSKSTAKKGTKEKIVDEDEAEIKISKTESGGGVCLVCNESFSQFGNCKVHFMKKHGEDGTGKYECLVCKSRFNFGSNFREHLKTKHNVTGTFKRVSEDGEGANMAKSDKGEGLCLLCSLVFSQFGNLKVHFKKRHA